MSAATTLERSAPRTAVPSPVDPLGSDVRQQLHALGYDPARCRYTPEELVQATAGAALTVAGFLRHTLTEEPLPRLVA